MIKKTVAVAVLVLLIILVTAAPAFATPFVGTPSPSLDPVFGTLIDFDDQATGTPVIWNDYAAMGVASIHEAEGLGTFARYAGSQSQPNYVGTGFGGERGTDANLGWDGHVVIRFELPTDRVGIGIANSQGGPETVSIYDVDHNLLESMIVPAGSNVYVGFDRDDWDVKYLEIVGDYFAIDDMQFDRNQAPDCSAASPSIGTLWAPNHKFVTIEILGATDPDGDPLTVTITSIWQDEPVNSVGEGNTAPDGRGVGTSAAEVRAERSGVGNGRVYHIGYEVSDGKGGVCIGEVLVTVPRDSSGVAAVDDGALYDSSVTP